MKEKIEQLKKQVQELDTAMRMFEGKQSQPVSMKTKIKEFLTAWLPARQKDTRILQEEIEQLSYSMLHTSKQLSLIILTTALKKEVDELSDIEDIYA